MRTIRPIKNWNVEYSCLETRIDPYQKTRAMTKNAIDCEKEYNRPLHMAVVFECWSGISKLWL
jgi:hypothetical protein